MKYTLYIVAFLVIGIIVLSCTISQSNTTLIARNQSDNFIDSVVFNINGYAQKISEVEANTEKKIEVSKNSIPNNNHDILVVVKAYMKDGKVISNQFYNDLTGAPGKSITAAITKELQLILKPEW